MKNVDPLSPEEIARIRSWYLGTGPPPSIIVNVGRWLDTIKDLQDRISELETECSHLENAAISADIFND